MELVNLHKLALTEDLGNLAQLKVGRMINILKQVNGGKWEAELHPISGNFRGDRKGTTTNRISPDISETSQIVDVGVIKNGIAGLRKAIKTENQKRNGYPYEMVEGFALYIDGKAVAFAKCDETTLSGSSRHLVLAYDLSAFKEQLDKEYEEELAGKSEWSKQYVKRRKDTSDEKREVDKYSYKYDPKRPVENYAGQSISTAYLKKFIEDLIRLSGRKPITCKLVLKDVAAGAKRHSRYLNRPPDSQHWNDLNTLENRLKRYKISKKPSASNIEDFLKMVLNDKIKVIQFDGHGYSTTPTSYDKLNPLSILSGHQFKIQYSSVDPGYHGSIYVTYKFNPETSSLVAFKADWKKENESREHPLEPETYLKDVLHVNSIQKEDVLREILSKLREGPYNFPRIRAIIHACKKAGYDYPEFKAIEKSIQAAKDNK